MGRRGTWDVGHGTLEDLGRGTSLDPKNGTRGGGGFTVMLVQHATKIGANWLIISLRLEYMDIGRFLSQTQFCPCGTKLRTDIRRIRSRTGKKDEIHQNIHESEIV